MSNEDIIKTCWNCGNNSGDKTDCSNKNPCTNCAVLDSFGFVNLVPANKRINWVSHTIVNSIQ